MLSDNVKNLTFSNSTPSFYYYCVDNLYDNLYDTATYNSLLMKTQNGKCYTYTAEEIELYRKKLIASKLLDKKKSISNQFSSLVKEIIPLEKKVKKTLDNSN